MLVVPVNKVISINNNEEGAAMRKTTQTARKRALKRVTSLVDNGHTITNARVVVAGELGITPTTLANWQNTLNKKRVKTIKATTTGHVKKVETTTANTIARTVLVTLMKKNIAELNTILEEEVHRLETNT